MRDPRIAAMAHAYVTDAVFDCLRPSPVQLERYRDQVFQRFASDAIADTTERVLADSFAKVRGFVLPTISERLARGLDVGSVALLPALFLQFLQRWHRGELDIIYTDQAMGADTAASICSAPDPVAAFCAQRALWEDLAGDPRLRAALRRASLQADGFMAA
jgi:D-arabinitol 4-dehydrogenase